MVSPKLCSLNLLQDDLSVSNCFVMVVMASRLSFSDFLCCCVPLVEHGSDCCFRMRFRTFSFAFCLSRDSSSSFKDDCLENWPFLCGSIVVVALGVFSTFGVAVMLGQAAVVAFFGATQAHHRNRLHA